MRPNRVAIRCAATDETLRFAVDELVAFFSRYGVSVDSRDPVSATADWVFVLRPDQELQAFSYALAPQSAEQGAYVYRLIGHDSSCVLHAVYTMMERLGASFDITGASYPAEIDISSLLTWSTVVQPKIKRRGVRQHLNFPMDISSYPLREAVEYVRNLARLKFNRVTFHSYPGQWYECRRGETATLAGSFFYGERYTIPAHSTLRRVVRNDGVYCIPEIEPYYDDLAKRSESAVAWLYRLLAEAKRVGISIQFSFEPRDSDTAEVLDLCECIVSTYPMIDSLELITQECGGIYASIIPSRSGVLSFVQSLFGERTADCPEISREVSPDALRKNGRFSVTGPGIWQLTGTLRELAKNIEVARHLEAKWRDGAGPSVCLGVYATDHSTLRIAKAVLERNAPESVHYAFLPAHGARAAGEAFKEMRFSPRQLGRSLLYSWIEFDGSMYLQQNCIRGLRELYTQAESSSDSDGPVGICLNHWRTAENRTAFRYAAIAGIRGGVPEQEFYSEYASELGIGQPTGYVRAMMELDDVQVQVRDELGNIGFCAEASWWYGHTDLGYIGRFNPRTIQSVIERYRSVCGVLEACLDRSTRQDGRDYLSFLVNRIRCTEVHLATVLKLTELNAVCDGTHPLMLDHERRAAFVAVCDEALERAQRYIELHARWIVDRGCEGTIISYYHTIHRIIGKLKAFDFGRDGALGTKIPDTTQPPEPAIH